MAGTSNLDGDVNVGGDLAVTGDSVFTGDVEFQQPMAAGDLTVSGLFALDGFGNNVDAAAVAIQMSDLGTGQPPIDCVDASSPHFGKLSFFQIPDGRIVLAMCTTVGSSTMWKYLGGVN